MDKILCIHHHLGLGDHFDMNGAVRLYAKKWDKVYIFSKNSYYHMINFMYRDNDKIEVIKIDKDKNEIEQVDMFCKNNTISRFIRIGFDQYAKCDEEGKNCWEVFYDQIGFPYSVRRRMFHVERDFENEQKLIKRLNPNGGEFIFLHDDPSRGYTINKEFIEDKSHTIIENDNSINIFWFLGIIEQAKEIHCMESSFKTLVDIYAQTDRLFFHDFRGHPLGNHSNKNWKIVKY